MMKSLMICSKNADQLRLNESEKINTGRYILEGPVATLDKINRNQRIYPKEEYLKHLEYLRDDLRHPEKGWMLGEPGHPADRFETDIKEASHRILDLWYKPETNQVMGKIELLDTPNGKLLKELVDEGMPLCISSRASGTVGKDNIVDIQQIFTYDVVIKPGFEDAVLHRVNESADAPEYSAAAKDFCRAAVAEESMSVAGQLGLDENFSIISSKANPEIRPEAKAIAAAKLNENNIEDMTRPITESVNPDDTLNKPLDTKESTNQFDPSKIVTMKTVEDENLDSGKQDNGKQDDGKQDDGGQSSEKKDKTSDDIKIIDVRADFGEDGDSGKIVKDVEPVYKDDDDKSDDGDADKSDDKSDDGDSGKKDVDECGAAPDASEHYKKECGDGKKKTVTDINEIKDKKDGIEKSRKDFGNKLDELIDGLKKKKAKNESLVARYPHAGLMNESSFSKFAKLDRAQQDKVSRWLNENQVWTPDAVNALWEGALTETVDDAPVWLKNAPDNYRRLYESASDLQKKNLQICAKYCVFESQRDIDNFWENSGLMRAEEARLMNEAYVNSLPKITDNSSADAGLPYSSDYIKLVGEAADGYNRS